jgi:hypothetical protein
VLFVFPQIKNLLQVIRDYRKCAEKPGASTTVASKNDLRAEMEKFMVGESHKVNSGSETHRLSNIICLKALDHALEQGIGRTLPEFFCESKLRPLTKIEKRYGVENDDLELEFVRDGCTRRSCIENTSTNTTRYELPVEIIDTDSLFIFSDQGSTGWVAWIFVYVQLNMMGFPMFDVCHHTWNELCNGLKAGGNWFFILELIVVLNLCSGPFSGSAWFLRCTSWWY